MSFSGPFVIQYAANPTMCLAASRQLEGAQLNLQPTTASPSLTLWAYNHTTGQIALVSTNYQLVIDVQNHSFANETPLILNAISYTSPTMQAWSPVTRVGYITSLHDADYVIDDRFAMQNPGETAWLYKFNGSEAQQWNIIHLPQFMAAGIG